MHLQVSSFTILFCLAQFLYFLSLQTHLHSVALQTLFDGQVSGALSQIHRQSFLLHLKPSLQGVGGLSPNLHLHWQSSGFQSSNYKLQSSKVMTHWQPHWVWFRSLIIFVSPVLTIFTLTETSLYCSGTHDLIEGWMSLQDPPQRSNFTKYGKNLKLGLSIATSVERGLQSSLSNLADWANSGRRSIKQRVFSILVLWRLFQNLDLLLLRCEARQINPIIG